MHLGFSSMNTAQDPAPDLLARTLEQAGFESLWYGEHRHISVTRRTPYPGGRELPGPYRKMMAPYISLLAPAAGAGPASFRHRRRPAISSRRSGVGRRCASS